MRCGEYQEFFSDLFDGTLAFPRRKELEAHLSACGACRREYRIFCDGLGVLHRSAPLPVSAEFTRRLTAVLPQARADTRRAWRRPGRSAWAFGATAAGLLVAFAGGYQVRHAMSRGEADAPVTSVAQAPAPAPALPAEPRTPAKEPHVSPDELVRRRLEARGFERTEWGWISPEARRQLEAGQMWTEQGWIDAERELSRRAQELARQTQPEAPVRELTREELCAKLGMVSRGPWIMPQVWADALDRGLVISATGDPRPLSDLVAEVMRDQHLVVHDGRWMTEEQREELLARPRVRKSDFINQDTPVTRALDGLEIGPPVACGALTLFPLLGARPEAPSVLSLHEAIGAGKIEMIDDGHALQVRVRNKGDANVLLAAGDILVGGKHQRIVARDTILPAKKADLHVEVYDADSAVVRSGDRSFGRESGHYWGSIGLRRVLNAERGQAAVWAELRAALGREGAAVELYSLHRTGLLHGRAAVSELRESHPDMVGVAIAIGDRVANVEVFAGPGLLNAYFERVVASAALEAELAEAAGEARGRMSPSAGFAAVKRLLESTFTAEHKVEGDTIAVRLRRVPIARAAIVGGTAIRVSVFEEQELPAHPVPDVAVAKIHRVLAGYEARLKAAPAARRPAVIREMAALPSVEVTQTLLQHLNEPDAKIRLAFLEALGQRGDPRACKSLLKALEVFRKDPPTYAAAAQALARIGCEEAAAALIQDIDPKTLDLARAAGEHLPLLLRGLKNANVVEQSVGELVQRVERIHRMLPETDLQGTPWTLRTLQLTIGLSFSRVSDYALWWNNPSARMQFLESWKK